MMNGIGLAVTILVYATGVSPAALETSRATIVPAAATFDRPDGVAALRNPSHRILNEQSRPAWRDRSLPPPQPTTARHTKTTRIIAVAAGAFGGFMAGGMIGYAVTPKMGEHDDVSGLRGVVIGAPIGAVVGAIIGYKLTN